MTISDGRIKLWVTMQTLNFRREHPELFRTGKYIPLQANRGKEDHVVAFARVRPGEAAIVVAPRLSYTLMKGNDGTARWLRPGMIRNWCCRRR